MPNTISNAIDTRTAIKMIVTVTPFASVSCDWRLKFGHASGRGAKYVDAIAAVIVQLFPGMMR